ncbi:MAG: ABC transporter permease [Planctomycetes bacterium]|nr:ABC transporter permease [Planctomycetota bacterium]
MRRYAAVLKDSLVETLDRKSLTFLLAVSAFIILLCASVGYRELDAEGTLRHLVRHFNTVATFRGMNARATRFDVHFDVSDVREVVGGEGDSSVEYECTLTAAPVKEFHRCVLAWQAAKSEESRVEGDSVPEPGPEAEESFVQAKFRERFIPRVTVRGKSAEGDARAFDVRIRTSRRAVLEGSHEISVLFGAWSTRLPTSVAVFLIGVEVLVAEYIAGIFGLLIAIVFTAGFVPAMLQKGTLDLVLARPIRRPGLLLTKYVGGFLYIVFPAVLLIGGCWLILSWRADFFNFGFLASIGLLLATFALLHSFSVLCGVLFRSSIASIMMTVGLWGVSWLVGVVRDGVHAFQVDWAAPGALVKALDALHLILPKTRDLGRAAVELIARGNLGAEASTMMAQQAGAEALPVQWGSCIASSALFVAVMLTAACWVFSRRDY